MLQENKRENKRGRISSLNETAVNPDTNAAESSSPCRHQVLSHTVFMTPTFRRLFSLPETSIKLHPWVLSPLL